MLQKVANKVMKEVAILWDNVEEIESTIAHMKSKVPHKIFDLRKLIEKQSSLAGSLEQGSPEAALAYEHLEELSSALARIKEARRESKETEITQISMKIE